MCRGSVLAELVCIFLWSVHRVRVSLYGKEGWGSVIHFTKGATRILTSDLFTCLSPSETVEMEPQNLLTLGKSVPLNCIPSSLDFYFETGYEYVARVVLKPTL